MGWRSYGVKTFVGMVLLLLMHVMMETYYLVMAAILIVKSNKDFHVSIWLHRKEAFA
jgi:hypothetical protein